MIIRAIPEPLSKLLFITLVWLACIRDIIVAAEGFAEGDAQSILKDDQIKRIAIIGAGAGGSSAAYYLQEYALESQIPISITVYERSHHIGGRSTTVNIYDDPSEPIELGASIFVQVNRNLVTAVERFGLRLKSAYSRDERCQHKEEEDDAGGSSATTAGAAAKGGRRDYLGIWNGESFVYVQAHQDTNWWGKAKLMWKYGLAPLRTVNLMKRTVASFLKMYDAPHFPFASLSETARELGLLPFTSSTGEQVLRTNGVGDAFAKDVVQAATRVNYAQNLGLIHGLETMVCMAAEGAMAVEGGNWQIFDAMLDAAGADVRLNTSVVEIEERDDDAGGFVVRSRRLTGAAEDEEGEEQEEQHHFDTIILAAPYQFANINFSPPLPHPPPKIPYVSLHVTLFSTPRVLSPTFFNLPTTTSVPEFILTTLSPTDHPGTKPDGTNMAGSANFFSISLLRTVLNPRTQRQENVYKIFSPSKPSSTFLAKLLDLPSPAADSSSGGGGEEEEENENGDDGITWRYEKRWDAYPYLYPRVTFEDSRLGGKDGKGLWYTSPMESFISTMETMSLMGMNVARLVVDGWVGEMDTERESEAEVEAELKV